MAPAKKIEVIESEAGARPDGLPDAAQSQQAQALGIQVHPSQRHVVALALALRHIHPLVSQPPFQHVIVDQHLA